MKNGRYDTDAKVFTVACSLALVVAACVAKGEIVENTESPSWSGTNKFGSVTVTNLGSGQVIVSFGKQSPTPSYTAVDIVSGGDASGTPFAGDYSAAGISDVVFRIRADTSTSGLIRATLTGGYSGLTWIKQVPRPPAVGIWVTNIVSVCTKQGWSCGISDGPDFDTSAVWSNDIRSVRFAGVRLSAGSTNAESYTIDTFILVGPNFASAPAHLVFLGDALEARFGVRTYGALTTAQKALDADGDGMTDINEILTGTNPDDRNSIFAAQVVASKAKGITICWPAVEGGVYTVSRTSDLIKGVFTAVPQGYRLTATSTGYMEFTDTTVGSDGGPYFYRVTKE
jgi:hypothetical protein